MSTKSIVAVHERKKSDRQVLILVILLILSLLLVVKYFHRHAQQTHAVERIEGTGG